MGVRVRVWLDWCIRPQVIPKDVAGSKRTKTLRATSSVHIQR